MSPKQRLQRNLSRGVFPLKFDAESCEIDLTAATADNNVVAFSSRAYSGGMLYVEYGGGLPVVVDLSGVTVRKVGGVLPINLDHESEQRVGHADQINVTASEIQIAGVTSANNRWRDEVVDSHRNGYRFSASIEGRVLKSEEFKKGKSVTVNNRRFSGPVIVARQFELLGVGIVSKGGDPNANISLAAKLGVEKMKFDELTAQIDEIGIEDLTDEQKTNLVAKLGIDKTPPPVEQQPVETPDVVADLRAELATEANRIADINRVSKGFPEIIARGIAEGWDKVRTELEVLKAERDAWTGPGIHMAGGGQNHELPDDVLCALMCMSHGVSKGILEEEFNEATLHEATKKKNRSLGLHAMMYRDILTAGLSIRPGLVDNEFIRKAFEADRILKANDGFSTITTTGVLENLANKLLLDQYRAASMIATQICNERSVNDFKLFKSYRVTTNGLLLELGDAGEIKHTDLVETEFQNQLKTYARMFAIPRKMLINDDLDAFTQAVRQFGRVAARTVDYIFHGILLDNTDDFFSAGNGNYLAGAATAFGIDSMTTGEKLFLDQEDDAGYPAMISPQILLVTTGNKVPAEQLYNDTKIQSGTTVSESPAGMLEGNPHAGKYPPVVSQWLSKTGLYAAASEVGWYLFCQPSDGAAMELAYLRGQTGPTIESTDTDFNTLGMQTRAYHDFGIAKVDPKCAIFMKGEV